jgi:hypothetical protein
LDKILGKVTQETKKKAKMKLEKYSEPNKTETYEK